MKLEQTFTVHAPIDVVWAALIDVERIAPCLPGAQITGQDDTGAWTGTFTVKLGPTTASYNGKLHMQDLDEAHHVATLAARGTDKRGQGGATATIVNTLRAEGDATVVEVDTDFNITGKLARFGRSGMIQDISNKLLRDFAGCLETTLSQPAPAPEPAAEAPNVGGVPPDGGTADVRPASPPPPAAAPISGVAVALSVLKARLRALFGNRKRLR